MSDWADERARAWIREHHGPEAVCPTNVTGLAALLREVIAPYVRPRNRIARLEAVAEAARLLEVYCERLERMTTRFQTTWGGRRCGVCRECRLVDALSALDGDTE